MTHHASQAIVAAVLLLSATSAFSQTAPTPTSAASVEDTAWPEAWFEIFTLAPGQHEAFVRDVAKADEVAAAGGQPPIQLFFHQEGADWDVLMFKPVTHLVPTAEQEAAMEAKRTELSLPSGPAYFIAIRTQVASHTDTRTVGPVSAAQWLGRLDAWRAAH